MNVSLTPELENFIEQEVDSGMYQSASEVIRAGLRLLREEKKMKPRFVVSSMEELQHKLLSAAEQLDNGQGIPSDETRRLLDERIKARLKQDA